MRKPILIISILIIITVTLFGVRAVVSNKLSTSGISLGETQEEIGRYQTENAFLKEKILSVSSLSYVSSAAAKLGFSKSKSNFAVKTALPIARR